MRAFAMPFESSIGESFLDPRVRGDDVITSFCSIDKFSGSIHLTKPRNDMRAFAMPFESCTRETSLGPRLRGDDVLVRSFKVAFTGMTLPLKFSLPLFWRQV